MKRRATCPIYGMEVIFCDDPDETLEIVNKLRAEAGRKLKDPDYYKDIDGACSNAGDAIVFAIFAPELSVVAHESVHAASKTLRERNIHRGPEDDHENLTYLVEWYFNEWIKRMGWKVTIRQKRNGGGSAR